jgi:hypothetical protein
MKLNGEILVILKKLSDRSASHGEIHLMVRISARIARAYITRHHYRVSRLYEYFEVNQEEMAMDAVAGLFCMDKERENFNIINSFNSWKPVINSEAEALYFLNKIVASGVEQYLSEMLREADPVFSKIYNSMNYTIKKCGFTKIEHIGCKYIVRRDEGGFKMDLIDPESFDRIPAEIFAEKEVFLEGMLGYIESIGFAPAIPLNQLVTRIKRACLNIPYSGISDSLNQTIIIKEVIETAETEIEEFLRDRYQKKGKLTDEETEHFLMALKDMTIDLRDGGLNPGLYSYLEKYIPGLQKSPSYDKYHNILEYLLKMLKKRISAHLMGTEISE